MRKRQTLALLAGALAAALLVSACSSGPESDAGGGPSGAPPAAEGSPRRLKGVCPDTVVIQSNWYPEAEHGAVYQLLGEGYKVDAAKKSVTGPLVASGEDTGVQIEIRAGGPAVGFQAPTALMYQDPNILLGMNQSDQVVQTSKEQHVIGVVAPLELDPQIILWDPESHPDWHIITDIGQTDEKVLYFESSMYMEYLIGSGILRRRQVDGSYDGSPSTFVASGGKIAVQGYATNEPYLYEHEVSAWGKPVRFQLITDTGYPNYGNVLTVRADRKEALAPCLERLVPIIQQGQVDYMASPKATNDLLVELVDAYKGGFVYSPGLAEFAVEQMGRLGIVSNGNDSTLGNFDEARLKKLVDIVVPILEGQNQEVKEGLTVTDVATNEFIDPSIGLKT